MFLVSDLMICSQTQSSSRFSWDFDIFNLNFSTQPTQPPSHRWKITEVESWDSFILIFSLPPAHRWKVMQLEAEIQSQHLSPTPTQQKTSSLVHISQGVKDS